MREAYTVSIRLLKFSQAMLGENPMGDLLDVRPTNSFLHPAEGTLN